MLQREPEIWLRQLVAFALRREHKEKKIEKEWFVTQQQIRSTEYAALRNFLTRNFALLLNMREATFVKGDEGKSPIIEFPQGRFTGLGSKAFVVRFKKNTTKRSVIEEARQSKDLHQFKQFANAIVQWFMTTQYWPKTYLFIALFQITYGEFDESFLSILTTQLQHGKFVEDPSRIMEQLEKAMIGDKVKKSLVYPLITGKLDDLTTVERVKVYEDGERPAIYFYDFIDLQEPSDAQATAESVYSEFIEEPSPSLRKFLRELDEKVTETAKVKVEIGDIIIKITLSDLLEKFSFARLRKNRFLAIIEADRLNVFLGKYDLIYDQVIKVQDKGQITQYIQR